MTLFPFNMSIERFDDLVDMHICGINPNGIAWYRQRGGFSCAVSVVSAAFPGIIAYVLLWIIMPDEPV